MSTEINISHDLAQNYFYYICKKLLVIFIYYEIKIKWDLVLSENIDGLSGGDTVRAGRRTGR